MNRSVLRRASAAFLLLAIVATGCAGPSKLAQRSEEKLAKGDIWRAWQLATKALDREPMNPRAKSAVASAGQVIAEDWHRRIRALAAVDSVLAAEQVLAFTDFRANAARYTTIGVGPGWPAEEGALRRAAANTFYLQGRQAMAANRPKAAFHRFHDCERYVEGYRDAAKLADKAYESALTRIAVMPFSAPAGDVGFGQEVAERWRDALAGSLAPPNARFTRVLGTDAISSRMTVAQSARLSREEAVRVGRKSGAQRIVWGSVGAVTSETHLHFFRDVVARRITQKDASGKTVVRWVEVPIEVVARVRDVSVDVDYEVVSTADGASIAHHRGPRSTRARVVWTSYVPEGDLGQYSLVSETVRSENPARAREIEARWKTVCGETATLQQVLAARRETRVDTGYDSGTLGRFVAGAAFVFLKELPPAKDLAYAAVRNGWQPLLDDLVRLDGIDDVELGVAASGD